MPNLSESISNNSFVHLLQQPISWEYLGGSRYSNCCHQATGWRELPFLVIVCPIIGEYISEVENAGIFKVRPKEALLVPGGVRHTVAMPKPGVVHYAHIRFTIFGSFDITRFYELPYILTGDIAEETGVVVAELNEAMETNPDTYDTISLIIRRQELSSRLLRLITSVSVIKSNSNCLHDFLSLNPVFTFIEENLDQPISRSDLAEIANLSETRFHYVFKNTMGISPMAHVRSLRMRRAQILLMQTDMNINDVGERVGYPDIFHFSKVFKQTFGVSPLQYRKSLQQWIAGGRP